MTDGLYIDPPYRTPAMDMLSVVDLEQRSGVSRYTWRTWIAQGRIPVVRLGRLVKVKANDYEKFVADNRTEARE